MDYTNFSRRPPVSFGRVVVWGITGLMGASLGLALRERTDAWVVGLGRDADRLHEARSKGMAHEITTDPLHALDGANLLILSTPVDVLLREGPHLLTLAPQGCLVMDVGSVKAAVVRALSPAVPQGVDFVGAHPMAGSEKGGLEAADIDLYDGAVVALTPTPETSVAAMQRATEFWETLGSRVVTCTPQSHDQAVALVSHLPHAVASLLVLAGLQENGLARQLAATGFRDTTRVASGSPTLWRHILAQNRQGVLGAITHLRAKLDDLENLLASGHDEGVETLLRRAKELREALPTATLKKLEKS